MPSPLWSEHAGRSVARYSVALEPAISGLDSLMLLNSVPEVSGLGEWIVQTAAALPPEVARRNRLVLNGLYFAVLPTKRSLTFASFVNDLANMPPESLRDRLLHSLAQRIEDPKARQGDWSQVLASADTYLTFLREHFPHASVDEEIERDVFALLVHPDQMQAVIVSHLRLMWNAYLASEWERSASRLEESVAALERIALAGVPVLQAVRQVTGHELLGERQQILGEAHEIIFVPSLHTGPYLDTFVNGDMMWLIFGARLRDEDMDASSDLVRSEILVRLSALADDTRLRILALLGRQGELCSQDIMMFLQLTQSATSRHLRQLSAAGYLVERRREGSKCYSLNNDRLTQMQHALERFVSGLS
jgi:DNA-binding transcriptional ArsR family regulator